MATSDLSSVPRRAPAEAVMIGAVVAGLQGFTQCPHTEWRRLLGTVGSTPEELANGDALIPLHQGFAAFEAVAAFARKPLLGVDFAKSYAVGGTGPLGFAIVNARTVGEALRIASRFIPLVASMRDCRYEEDNVAGRIVWHFPGDVTTPRLQFVTFGIAVIMQRIASALPADWRPLAVELDMDPPAQRKALEAYFGPGVRFHRGLANFSLAVQADLLERQMPAANAKLFGLMTRLAEFEQRHRGSYASVFEGEVRQALGQLLRQGLGSASDLAGAMGLTATQLRAKFKHHQLSVRPLIDDVRREMALNYLTEKELSITDIAFALGYSDISVFTRACHKWFGRAPRTVMRRRPRPLL